MLRLLCRGQHRQLYQAGNELGWEDEEINALEIVNGLWAESHAQDIHARPKKLFRWNAWGSGPWLVCRLVSRRFFTDTVSIPAALWQCVDEPIASAKNQRFNHINPVLAVLYGRMTD